MIMMIARRKLSGRRSVGTDRHRPAFRLYSRIGVALVIFVGSACRAPDSDSVHVAVERTPPQTRTADALSRPSGTTPAPDHPVGQPRWPDDILTLDAARLIAVQDNPDVEAARARLAGAAARIDEAMARYYPTIAVRHTSALTTQTARNRPQLTSVLQSVEQLPTLSGTADPLQNVSPIVRPLLRPLFGTPTIGSNTNAFSDHSSAFTAQWTVFDGFIREAQIEAARFAHQAIGATLANVRRLLVHAVDGAYYQIQLAEEQLRIARADEVFSREQLDETEKLRQANRASMADADNFRVRMLAAQANVTAAIGARDAGRVVLAELMGVAGAALPDGLRLEILAEESPEEMAAVKAEDWLLGAVASRPDLRQLEARVAVERQNVRATRGLFSPAVALSGTWGFDRTGGIEYSSNDQASGGALEVRWELFTGGSREAKVRLAGSALAEASARLRGATLAVESQIRQAVVALGDAQEQIRLRRENLKTALENRRVIQVGYLAGREALTRLNEAQRDVLEADASLSLARIRLRRAWSDLHSAASVYPPELIDGSPEAEP